MTPTDLADERRRTRAKGLGGLAVLFAGMLVAIGLAKVVFALVAVALVGLLAGGATMLVQRERERPRPHARQRAPHAPPRRV